MGKVYDDWGRLVEAVVRREKDRQLCLQHSRSPSISSSSSSDCGEALSFILQASLHLDSLSSSHQMTMVRLQEVLIHNLSKRLHYQPMLIAPHQGISDEADELVLDLHSQMAPVDFLPPDMIPQLKSLGDAMFASCHGQDFCQALIGFTRATFGKCLAMLNEEKLCVDNIHDMTWHGLRSSINKWRSMIKIFIGSYLGSVKGTLDQILGEYGQTSLTSFIESSQESVMSLLDIGDAIVIKPHEDKLDALYVFLRAYRDVACLSPVMDALFPEEIGSIVRKKFYDLLTRLKESVKVIFKELDGLFQSCHVPLVPDGSIHPFTRYVMNHITCLLGHHTDTINLLVEDGGEKNLPYAEIGKNLGCPLAAHVQSVTAVLEARLDESSNSYKDESWKHLFMMNNIHYIKQKVSQSATCSYFGEEWISMFAGKVQWHAMCYLRLTWNHVVSLLRLNDGYYCRVPRETIRARGHAFTTAFDDVYQSQKRLRVPNFQLREELRLLAVQTVVPAYQTFIGRFFRYIRVKHIKYTIEDLENYIMDGLLEGSSTSVADSRKRGACFTLTRSK